MYFKVECCVHMEYVFFSYVSADCRTGVCNFSSKIIIVISCDCIQNALKRRDYLKLHFSCIFIAEQFIQMRTQKTI